MVSSEQRPLYTAAGKGIWISGESGLERVLGSSQHIKMALGSLHLDELGRGGRVDGEGEATQALNPGAVRHSEATEKRGSGWWRQKGWPAAWEGPQGC